MGKHAFRGQVVMITGASSGIGRALATAFARQGAHLALVGRNEAKLLALQEELAFYPGSRLVLTADVRDAAQARAAVRQAIDQLGRIDVLVNNAGIGQASTVEETSLDDYRDILDTNFFGVVHFTQAVLPPMRERDSGLIIQMSSLNGFFAIPLGSAYCTSKFALEAFSQSLRLELHRTGVRVLIARPGLTDTEFFDKAKYFRERNPFPMDRMMSPETVAEKIVAAAARGRTDLVLTAEGRLLWWLHKISPRLVDAIIVRFAKSPQPAAERAPRPSPLSAFAQAPKTVPSTDRTDAPGRKTQPTPGPAPRPAAK